MINKKGSMEAWMYGLMLAMVFVLIFTVVVLPDMNNLHSGDYDVEGLPTDSLQESLESVSGSMNEKISSGDVSFLGALGMTLSTSWDMIVGVFQAIAIFLAGGWIMTIGSMMHLPTVFTMILIGIYNLAIGFIVLRIIFKVRV